MGDRERDDGLGLGYWDDVMEHTAALLWEESIKVVRYEKHADFLDWFTQLRSPLKINTWLDQTGPRLMYLWKP